ncbi:MAG: capsule assembly Wzi family protein [Candidatus Krumholzibacteriia bacterium]
MSGARGLGPVETDARTVPWSTVERLALEAGLFPPAVRPVGEAELADLLDQALSRAAGGRAPGIDDRELAVLSWWRDRYAGGGWAPTWIGCTCQEDPPRLRAAGRALVGWQELGDPLAGEAGLAWAGGTGAAGELTVDGVLGGRWWLGVTGRGAGQLAAGTRLDPADPLAWPGWSPATGRLQVGQARQRGGAWTLDLPRAVVGARLGRWALAAGWQPRRTGPGLGGGLTLDHHGASFPAVTARRTAPFRWRGVMGPLAPSELLLGVGLVSGRDVLFFPAGGPVRTRQAPWFMTWLAGWRPWSWFRFTATHTVLAASQDGSLWPDLLQLNFPVVGTTWKEMASGPVTDRLFAVAFEFRWRDAPWPVLPAAAGRLWWQYGGTDFLPNGPAGLWPEIAAPASVLGLSLLDPRWDLSVEYAELWHDKILWYSNGGYPAGYTHRGDLLAHPLGGSGESVAVGVRVRPGTRRLEAGLTGAHATWGIPRLTPGEGERWSLVASLGRLPRPGERAPALWTLKAELRREEARPLAAAAARRTWGRLWLEVGLP